MALTTKQAFKIVSDFEQAPEKPLDYGQALVILDAYHYLGQAPSTPLLDQLNKHGENSHGPNHKVTWIVHNGVWRAVLTKKGTDLGEANLGGE